MKDAYSFDRDEEGLDASYELHIARLRPHLRPLRPALVPGRVGRRDDGRRRGARVHGALRGGRERGRALGRRLRRQRRGRHGHAARPRASRRRSTRRSRSRRRTRARSRRSRACSASTRDADQGAAGGVRGRRAARWRWCAATTALNEIKLRNALGSGFRPATEEEIVAAFGAEPGFIGPVGADVEVIADASLERGTYVAGRQRGRPPPARRRAGARLRRRRSPTSARSRRATRCPLGGTIDDRARDRGRQHLQARHPLLGAARARPTWTRTGSERPIVMGSYGIGPARIAAAAVEQYADEHGISWPRAIAPFDMHLVGARQARQRRARATPSASTTSWSAPASRCSTTTATLSPGEKFVEAELLGCPLRVVAGKRSLEAGELEVQVRRGTEQRAMSDRGRRERSDALLRRAAADVAHGPGAHPGPASPGGPGRRRPAPARRCARSRCRTWSATSGSRAGGLRGGRASPPTTGARRSPRPASRSPPGADYLDGLLARVTGQYSRLGALMDPLLDRLVVIAGVVVVLALRAAAALGAGRARGAGDGDGRRWCPRACACGWTSRSTGSAGWRSGPRCAAVGVALIFGPGGVAELAAVRRRWPGPSLATALVLPRRDPRLSRSFTAPQPASGRILRQIRPL